MAKNSIRRLIPSASPRAGGDPGAVVMPMHPPFNWLETAASHCSSQ
jgi:hypothetical protein